MTQHEEAVDRLNKIIRGEISAIETYVQACDRFHGNGTGETLQRLKREHIDATNLLREEVIRLDGQPSTDSGAWGTFVKATEGAAKALGASVALRALQEGEAIGVRLYESALQDDHIPAATKQLIRDRLLPQQHAHFETVRRLAATV